MRREISGIVSIGREGMMGEGEGEDVRLYVFPQEKERILYLLLVGAAPEKNADMEFCKTAVLSIVSERS